MFEAERVDSPILTSSSGSIGKYIKHARRNIDLRSSRKDALIDWIKELLNHSFVLNTGQKSYFETMSWIEGLVEEHRADTMRDPPVASRLQQWVPTG